MNPLISINSMPGAGIRYAANGAPAMIDYCAMIFPFLKSIVTLLVSVGLAVVCVYRWVGTA